MTQERARIKDIAFDIIKETGLINLSRLALCDRAKIKQGSFDHIMGCSFSVFVEELRQALPVDINAHPITKSRTNPALRKDHILDAAIKISAVGNYSTITRQEIADAAKVSTGLVARYFGTMQQVRRAVMRAARQRENLTIIAQGLVNNDPNALKAPNPLKERAMKSFYK